MFGEHGELLRYSSTLDIMKDFCKIRLRLYHERKDFMVGQLTAETKKITNQAKFVKEKVEKKISVCTLAWLIENSISKTIFYLIIFSFSIDNFYMHPTETK